MGNKNSGRNVRFDYDRIRAALSGIIEHEDKRFPCPDTRLHLLVEDAGIPCTRWAITKCRQDMGIEPARNRRIRNASN